jgi:hypothetical protein
MAAFLVLVIMISAIIAAFNRIQDNPFKDPVTLADSIKTVSNSLHELLGFSVGYYGSIIKLTGNVTYAKEKTNSYFESGLETVAHEDINSGVSLSLQQISVSTNWFEKQGFTKGSLVVNYSIPSLGIYGVKYSGSASLTVSIQQTVGKTCNVQVLGDNDEPNLSLTKADFQFLKYDDSQNTWVYINPSYDPIISNSGIYSITLPSGINQDAYYLQVTDQRGIVASSGYVRGAGDNNKDLTSYTYNFTWNPALYNSLNDPNMEIELLQNGTLRWLGQSLPFNGTARPIAPIPVKGIHLNQTINGINQETPFQIEDWGSNYRVPYGMTSNSTIFDDNCMIVFLVNHHVSKVTLWWDGSDTTVQTKNAYKNTYFTNDNTGNNLLDNGVITLDLSNFANGVKSTTKSTPSISSTINFARVNSVVPTYGSAVSYTLIHGVVRDIVQQEPEWSGGVPNSPDLYGHIVITLPAGTNYYTYRVRNVFVTTSLTRSISDLSVLQLKAPTGSYSQLTEDGQNSGAPIKSTNTLFADGLTAHQHQWSEYIDSSNRGVGLFMRSNFNDLTYAFDNVIGQHTGSISLNLSQKTVEIDPINRFAVTGFSQGLDVTWVGGVVNFNSGNAVDSIYPSSSGNLGLWVLVESPPTVTPN